MLSEAGRYLWRMADRSSLSQRASNRFVIAAWAGDPSRLSRVVEISRELATEAARLAGEKHETVAGFVESEWKSNFGIGSASERTKRWKARLADERAELVGRLDVRLKVTLNRFDEEIKGLPEDVLGAIDPTEVVAAEISIGDVYSGPEA